MSRAANGDTLKPVPAAGRVAFVMTGFAAGLALTCRGLARKRTSADVLHSLIGRLASCHTLSEICSALDTSFAAAFGTRIAIFTAEHGCPGRKYQSAGFLPDDGDLQNAELAVSSGTTVRCSRGPRGQLVTWFRPLTTWRGTVGAIALMMDRAKERDLRRQRELLDSHVSLTALSILRADLENEARIAAVQSDADRFQKALLHSISHNVRTPLSSIIGVLSTLQENNGTLGRQLNGELLDTARQEAERLNRLLSNLLDLSRLEAGALPVRADPCDVQDVIGAALEQLGAAAREREVELNICSELPFIRMDFMLIAQVLVNLLDNAVKYSLAGTPIALDVRLLPEDVEISVADRGQGIPEQHLGRIFEKFNRGHRTGETGGIGLGLSICKGFVEAHDGKIWAERREPHGTVFRFTLPLRHR